MTPTRSSCIRSHDAAEIDRKRAIRLKDISEHTPRYFATFKRAYGGHSLRAAVNAFCAECNGFDHAAIRDCTAPACPLWPYRPGRKSKGVSS